MSLNLIVDGTPKENYKKFITVYSGSEKSKRPVIFYFEGTGKDGTWCNWCKNASVTFASFVKRNTHLDIWKVGVGSEEEWKKTEDGKRINSFYENFPYILTVPTLVVVAVYHDGLRVASRISIPEDPTSLDFDKVVSLYVK